MTRITSYKKRFIRYEKDSKYTYVTYTSDYFLCVNLCSTLQSKKGWPCCYCNYGETYFNGIKSPILECDSFLPHYFSVHLHSQLSYSLNNACSSRVKYIACHVRKLDKFNFAPLAICLGSIFCITQLIIPMSLCRRLHLIYILFIALVDIKTIS